MYHCILNYNDILVLSFSRLKYPLSFFSQISNLCFICILCHIFLRQSKNSIIFFVNRTTFDLLFVGHQVKKKRFQCLSKIKVQLHSSFIIPKTINFSSRYQQVSTRIVTDFEINLFPCYLLVKQNTGVQTISP